MNKRGAAWTLLQTITIIGGVIAAILLVSIVYKFTSQERGEQAFIAMDSAMLTDAILSTPQDVQLVYPREFAEWYIRLDNASISIFSSQPNLNQTSLINYYFIPRKDIKIIKEDLKLSALYFIKENNTFRLDNKPAREVINEAEE